MNSCNSGDNFGTMIKIERATTPTQDVRDLIQELEADLSSEYPPEQRHGLSLDAIFQPHVRFFVATIGENAVGCGGIALFPTFAEVKRMYVREACRGQGVADAIIARLESEARDAGLGELKLETGTEQAAALRFYKRCGFKECGPFEPYKSMPEQSIVTSVFLEKNLEKLNAHCF